MDDDEGKIIFLKYLIVEKGERIFFFKKRFGRMKIILYSEIVWKDGMFKSMVK